MHCLTKRAGSSIMVQEVVSQRFSLCTFAQFFEPPWLRETKAFRHRPPPPSLWPGCIQTTLVALITPCVWMCLIKVRFLCVCVWSLVVRVGLTTHTLAHLVTCKADLRVNALIYSHKNKIQPNKSKKLTLVQLESPCESENEADVRPLGCDPVAFNFTE